MRPKMPLRLSPLMFFSRAVRAYGDRVGVIDSDQHWTYTEFASRCVQLARGLRALGVHPGDRVALLAPNTHRTLECYYAVPLVGAVLVPLNIRLGLSDYRYIVNHSGARVLLADPGLAATAATLAREVPDLAIIWLSDRMAINDPSTRHNAAPRHLAADARELFSEELIANTPVPGLDEIFPDRDAIDEDAVITLNYTSGTTAHPKGVMLTHRTAALNVLDFVIHGHLTLEDVYLHTLPMFHVNGWGGVWAVTAVGATHVCLPKIDPPQIVQLIDSFGVTMACSAPTVLVMLANDSATAAWRPQRLLRWYVGGAPPPAAMIRKMEGELGIKIVHVYGLTETGPWLTICEWRSEWTNLSVEARAQIKSRQGIGQILTGDVRVVRADLSEVAHDGIEMGEIVVRGPTVMKGYYNDPEATDEAFAGGWFHTGDLAVVHPDGYLQIVDRRKDLIISGGENISSVEVEGVLYQHPTVLEAAVVAVSDPKWGEVPKAFVVVRPGLTVSADDLVQFCRQRMARFKVPKFVEFVEALPKTATGKIQKYLLRMQALAQHTGRAE